MIVLIVQNHQLPPLYSLSKLFGHYEISHEKTERKIYQH